MHIDFCHTFLCTSVHFYTDAVYSGISESSWTKSLVKCFNLPLMLVHVVPFKIVPFWVCAMGPVFLPLLETLFELAFWNPMSVG